MILKWSCKITFGNNNDGFVAVTIEPSTCTLLTFFGASQNVDTVRSNDDSWLKTGDGRYKLQQLPNCPKSLLINYSKKVPKRFLNKPKQSQGN